MDNKNILSHIKDNWIVYAFAVQLVISYTITNQTLQDHTQRIEALEKKQEAEEVILTEIRVQLSSIQATVLSIKESIK